MAAKSGRFLRIKRDGVAVVGAQTDSVTINNEPIDITDKDDGGWRTLMADVGLRSVSCSVEGILKDATMISAAQASGSVLIDAGSVEIEGFTTLSGDFFLQSVELGAEAGEAITFTATLESSGVVAAALAPYNTVLPAVTGTVSAGQTLTGSLGTWGGDATITYARQWQSGPTSNPNDPRWANIASATAGTYVISGQTGKYIRVRVTATNSIGATVAFSNIVGPVAP
jgi:TP901-1 family phage major tail protein